MAIDFEELANGGMSAEQLANVFLREYFSGKEISYPINPFQMLTDLKIAFLLRPFKKYTTLKKKASMYDKIIFIADKISWDQKGVPPYYDILKEKVVESLDEACFFLHKLSI